MCGYHPWLVAGLQTRDGPGNFLPLLPLLSMSEDRWGDNGECNLSQSEMTTPEGHPGRPALTAPITPGDLGPPSPGDSWEGVEPCREWSLSRRMGMASDTS